jgi:hypothetical protein
MTKTDLPYSTAGDLRPTGDPSPAINDFKNSAGEVVFCFRHNISKKLSPGPKNSLGRRATRISTICATNQALNFFFDEIMKS